MIENISYHVILTKMFMFTCLYFTYYNIKKKYNCLYCFNYFNQKKKSNLNKN